MFSATTAQTTLPFWRKQNIFLQQCAEFTESTGAKLLVSATLTAFRFGLGSHRVVGSASSSSQERTRSRNRS